MNATPLDQPLPADVVSGATWGPFGFRRYPVFSLPWLKGRTIFIGVICVAYGTLTAVIHALMKLSWDRAIMSGVAFVLGFVLMSIIGPGLATWVRHRRWSPTKERWAVVAAIVIGIITAPAVDYFASGSIRRSLKPKEVPAKERKLGDLEKAQLALGGLFGLMLYFVLGGGGSLIVYFSEQRRLAARNATLSRLRADMRLAVLQAQVEPHFLFNTLAAIRPLIRQDAAQAEATLDALAEHLRAAIPMMRDSLQSHSTLGQQLDLCRSYLAVMQVRMGSRLHHEVRVAPELMGKALPPLLLISLVENAIKHGLEPKPGQGSLIIEAAATARHLTVRVLDDGVGLQPGLSSGLGLANIREQLALQFGGAASLTVAARPEGGTVAEITIPTTA